MLGLLPGTARVLAADRLQRQRLAGHRPRVVGGRAAPVAPWAALGLVVEPPERDGASTSSTLFSGRFVVAYQWIRCGRTVSPSRVEVTLNAGPAVRAGADAIARQARAPK